MCRTRLAPKHLWIFWFMREFAWKRRSLRTTPVKLLIAPVFAALLVFVALPNAWGQSSNVVKIRTLQINAEARSMPALAQQPTPSPTPHPREYQDIPLN